LWLACDTSWRWAPTGQTGLDYQAVRAIADAIGVDWTPRVFRGIRELEIDHLEEVLKHV